MRDPNARPSADALAAVRSVWQHRSLLMNLVVHDVRIRYRGSFVGIAWSVLVPLIMLGAYVLVFGLVFTPRWEGAQEGGRFGFAMFVFTGLIVFNLVAETVSRSSSAILENVNYVKKSVFPLEILPISRLGCAVVQAVTSTGVLVLALLASTGRIPASALLAPVVMLPLVIALTGVAWCLAATGVYVRDLGEIVGPALALLMFLSPIFFPVSAVPPSFRWIIEWGPLATPIEQLRRVLIVGRAPDWWQLVIYAGAACAIFAVGFFWFQRTRRGFADVL